MAGNVVGLTAFIFARGGSKGLPGKNIKILAGKPLIVWAIESALAVPEISRVVVSTDNKDIARVAQDHGAMVPFLRPAELAADTASEWHAWRHALEFLRDLEGVLPDPFISVPATAPLRSADDIAACLTEYRKGNTDIVLTVTESHSNPWFTMVKTKVDGTIAPINNLEGTIIRRQDAPEVRDVTPVAYVADPHFILEQNRIFSGRVRPVAVPRERAIDIDTPYDFTVAELLMQKRLSDQG